MIRLLVGLALGWQLSERRSQAAGWLVGAIDHTRELAASRLVTEWRQEFGSTLDDIDGLPEAP